MCQFMPKACRRHVVLTFTLFPIIYHIPTACPMSSMTGVGSVSRALGVTALRVDPGDLACRFMLFPSVSSRIVLSYCIK